MTSDLGAQVAKVALLDREGHSLGRGRDALQADDLARGSGDGRREPGGRGRAAFWDFYGENYAAAQAIAVRRQADRDARTCSLARLIKEMQDDAELLTRDYYVGLLDERTDSDLLVKRANSDFDRLAGSGDHLDPEIAARDFEVLQNDAHRLRVYVNEHVAHDMAEPTVPEMPTYADLHAAIDSVGEIFKKYAVTLTGGWWATLEPAIQGDWKAIFRVPWLPS